MAKSSRSAVRKENNRRLKSKVFGPVESDRNERLSKKLLELAAQPKPERQADDEMKLEGGADDDTSNKTDDAEKDQDDATNAAMDVDSGAKSGSKPHTKHRISKRKKVNKIVFPKWGEKRVTKRRKH